MSDSPTTEDHFASADRLIATARASWAEERKALEDQLRSVQTELGLTKDALTRACEARDKAFQTTVKLVTQFGIVAQVFEEAKELAIASGLYSKPQDGDMLTKPPAEHGDVDSERG